MNGKNEPCRLCQSKEELRFSHILPEFLYKPLYDNKHRFVGLTQEPDPGANENLLQKGIREYLLCDVCEQHLSKYERYAAEVLRKLPDMSRQPPGAVVRVTDIDYAQFKLFQLSLLWRAGVSNQASFQEVFLGPHEEKIRQMICKGDPGEPLDYGCVLIRTSGPEKLDQFILPPRHLRFHGHHGYEMLVAGMIWVYVVSSHSNRMREKDSFLAKNDTLPIHIDTETGSQFITGLGRELRNRGIIGN
jgi:hypothetical protein